MHHRLRLVLSGLLLCALCMAIVACGRSRSRGDDDDSADTQEDNNSGSDCGYPEGATDFGTEVGQLLPSVLLTDQLGEVQPLEAFCGDTLIIHVDAPWNSAFYPISEELSDLYDGLSTAGLSIVGALIDIKEPSELSQLSSENNISYPLFMISSPQSLGNISGIPHLIVVDSEMRILCTQCDPSGLTEFLSDA